MLMRISTFILLVPVVVPTSLQTSVFCSLLLLLLIEIKTSFIPIVMSACEAMGPSIVDVDKVQK